MQKYLCFAFVAVMMMIFVACTPNTDDEQPKNVTSSSVSESITEQSKAVTGGTTEETAIAKESPPRDPGPLYKGIEPRPVQRETDLRTLKIVTPSEDKWIQGGKQVAKILKEKWDIKAAVTVSDSSQFENSWEGNVLVIGNFANNAHIAKLYSRYLAYSDAVHPGEGGYQFQTIVDPFGEGGNTVLFGISDLEGLEKGTKRFGEILDGLTEPVLPWLSESKMSMDSLMALSLVGTSTKSMNETIERLVGNLNPNSSHETDANYLLDLMNISMQYGQLYQLTCNESYGEVYKKGLLKYAEFLNTYPSMAMKQLGTRTNMWTKGYPLIASYTVMEASPLFEETDRKQIVSALYLTYRANSHDPYITRAPATGARHNHQIFPALSMMFGSSYFINYYDLPEAYDWYDSGYKVFKGNTANIGIDEGSDYLMHVPAITLEYALFTADNRFLMQGLRPSADLYMMMIDNLGTMSGGGDVYPFGRSSAYSWDHSQVLNAASWIFDEPLYRCVLERTKTGPFDGQQMPDLKFPFHRYMADNSVITEINNEFPMVLAYPVELGIYEELKSQNPDVAMVPMEDAFHKLAFREGYDLDDPYLMLDGFSAGGHGHQDGNTIINYSANERLFIVDRDYIEKAAKNHTGMLIIQDGEQDDKPLLTALEWAIDADGIGVSRSTVKNYNGADWTRTIVSPGGRFFIICDDLLINEDGNFIFENTWQTIGNLEIKEDGFEVTQQGVKMNLQSLDESYLREYERYGHFKKYWKGTYPYPYAYEEHVLREVKNEKAYKAGDVSSFINVLSSTKTDTPYVNAMRLNEDSILIKENGEEWYATKGHIISDDFESDGKFHLISDQEILSMGVTEVRIGEKVLKFVQPVTFKVNPAEGRWETFGIKSGMTDYDEYGHPIRDNAADKGSFKAEKNLVENFKQELKKPDDSVPAKPEDEKVNFKEVWALRTDIEEAITASSKGDVNGDGRDDLLIGGEKGFIKVINADGKLLWTFKGRGRINEITCQFVKGKPYVFVATEEWFVYMLDSRGNEIWRTLVPNDKDRREIKGNLLGVTNVRIAHIEGQDKDPWVMVGTQFRYLYGYDLIGNRLYENMAYYYGIDDMEFLDLDGDGKDEGILALEYASYVILDNGSFTNYGGTTGPGFTEVEVLEDWSGGDGVVFVYGTKRNRVHLISYSGKAKELWSVNVGGEVNDIKAGDFDGDGITEILTASDGFHVFCLNPNGKIRWKTTLCDRVMKLDVVNTDDGINYLAAVDNGTLYRLDAGGKIVSKEVFGGLLQDVHAGNENNKAWVVLKNGQIYETK